MPKNVLITGSAGNLGTAVTKYLQDQGHSVIGTTQYGHAHPDGNVDIYETDLSDELETKELFKKLKPKYKKLDATVLLVGGFAMGSITTASHNDMMAMLKLNYFTAYNCAKEAYDWMNRSSGGQIIFIGAKPAVDGGAAQVLPYTISKSAVIKLAEILNESENKDIQASVIVPSIIDTPDNRSAMPDANFEDWVKPQKIAEIIGEIISDDGSGLRGKIHRIYNNK